MLAIFPSSIRQVAVVSLLAVMAALGACGGGSGGGGGGGSNTSSGTGSSSGSSSSGGSTSSSTSSGGTSLAPTALLVAPASGKAYWSKGVATQFSLKDAAGNAVAGPYTCASDNTNNLTVAADCSTVAGKRLGQQTITVSGGGVSAKATVKVIPQPQPIGTNEAVMYSNLVATADGRVLAWGSNDYVQLGQGQYPSALASLSLPTAVKDTSGQGSLSGIVAVSVGFGTTLALSEDGEVYSWGDNYNKQLGRPAVSGGTLLPGKVIGPDGTTPLRHIVSVAIGYGNALALADDGAVYSWGILTSRSGSDPSVVAGPVVAVGGSGYLAGAVAISASWNLNAVLLEDGRIVTWGYADSRGDGMGHGAKYPDTVNSAPPGYVISKTTGQPVTDAVSISVGANFGLALASSGTAYAWGDDGDGQLGQNTQYENAYSATPVLAPSGSGPFSGLVMVVAGAQHALALDSRGRVFSWGAGGKGQLGDGSNHSAWYQKSLPAPVVGLDGVAQIENVAAIAAGASHSLALTNDGTSLIWGSGTKGNLGQGTSGDADSYIPKAVKNEAGTGTLNLGPMSYWPNLTRRAR